MYVLQVKVSFMETKLRSPSHVESSAPESKSSAWATPKNSLPIPTGLPGKQGCILTSSRSLLVLLL